MECGSYDDIVSVFTFGDEGRIEYEGVKIRRASTRQFNFHGGGTFYAKGLREALALISRTETKTYRPVVIFFTDGRPVDRKQVLKMGASLRKYASVGLLRFGKVSDFGLEDLASALGGKVHEACSMDMLTETFRSISMLLRCVVRTAMRKERTSQPLRTKTSMLIENVAACAYGEDTEEIHRHIRGKEHPNTKCLVQEVRQSTNQAARYVFEQESAWNKMRHIGKEGDISCFATTMTDDSSRTFLNWG
ncbi:hypothetical protein PsorP6_000272 [Peronosclerospora sorghi]|uniref:Uncharacterized protein n=1 Tax=Peronosclerospora sorghi TaxID=230839 RepID=A0ACC0WP17_9STRA|nr:hypothetical protein PsorP6_000272 [Peronosclerospora sorghi]